MMIDRNIPVVEIEKWLREEDETKLEELWKTADGIRKQEVGDEVHLRGLLEISNNCIRSCEYCGLRKENQNLARYRMTEQEIYACAQEITRLGYGTVVMQAGEDYGIDALWLSGIVRRIKQETPLAVTLSLGERSIEELGLWKQAGADRYLLRFETSDPLLYQKIHPALPGQHIDRLSILKALRELGYEVGSGIMIGIPGQTYSSVAGDIGIFRQLELDMIGVGPFIPNPTTPLGLPVSLQQSCKNDQVPSTDLMTYKVLALARIVCPQANIPATTALGTLDPAMGRRLALSRGANVLMPNVTPQRYREQYLVYPGKPGEHETSMVDISGFLYSIGRRPGKGPGGRLRN